jgi:hypothetical protein
MAVFVAILTLLVWATPAAAGDPMDGFQRLDIDWPVSLDNART